jgi:spermidine/putrescine transport system permease protein
MLYSPILIIVIFSFTEAKVLGNWTGFSFKLYTSLFREAFSLAHQRIVEHAHYRAYRRFCFYDSGNSSRHWYIQFETTHTQRRATGEQHPILNPDIITAISLFLLFVSLGITQGYTTVILAHITFCTPYVVLSVYPRLQRMNENLYEAALDLGATPFTPFGKFFFPNSNPV